LRWRLRGRWQRRLRWSMGRPIERRVLWTCAAAADARRCLKMWITKSLKAAGNANRLSGSVDLANDCAALAGDTFPVIGGPEVENTMTVGCCSYYYAVN